MSTEPFFATRLSGFVAKLAIPRYLEANQFRGDQRKKKASPKRRTNSLHFGQTWTLIGYGLGYGVEAWPDVGGWKRDAKDSAFARDAVDSDMP